MLTGWLIVINNIAVDQTGTADFEHLVITKNGVDSRVDSKTLFTMDSGYNVMAHSGTTEGCLRTL